MTSTLSPNTQNWTRWHQDRLINTEMDRDLSGAPNQKYINVSKYPQCSCQRTFISTETISLSQNDLELLKTIFGSFPGEIRSSYDYLLTLGICI